MKLTIIETSWNFNEFNIEFFELRNFLSPEKSHLVKSIWWAKSPDSQFQIHLDLQDKFFQDKIFSISGSEPFSE